ncbi:hypothetical protein [Psychrobacter sp. I-STPA6b]|uniref:hypothetical protein n=1 Tax=Psychrobacter sp. I-STPA6b TaxID=2585718 RepID=UPI001D0BFF0D|nr:hypothetical protein [Psychrobacter sp. I-STPA6b]
MYARPIINPVQRKVSQIIIDNDRNGNIPHRLFDNIRNRGALHNILRRFGYLPDDFIKPSIWFKASRPKQKQETPRELSNKATVLKSLKNNGFVKAEDFDMSATAFRGAIKNIRRDGYDVVALKQSQYVYEYHLIARH